MLGDCEVTGEEIIPKKVPVADGSMLTSPPPAKKLKQARLPFKILDQKPAEPKPVTTPTPTKKRKPSDGAPGPQKAAKIPKNDENSRTRRTSRQDDAENEVSSSSEAESLNKPNNNSNKLEKPRGLERFVQSTQQLEVSTSSEVIDLTSEDGDGNANKETCNRDNKIATPAKTGVKNDSSEKIPTEHNEGKESCEMDTSEKSEKQGVCSEQSKSVTKDVDQTAKATCDKDRPENEAGASDMNESVISQNTLDTTGASTNSNTSGESDDNDDDESESESGKSSEKSSIPSTPSTPATPSQRLLKRPPSSSTKDRGPKQQERERLKAEKIRLKEIERQKKEEQRKERERLKEEQRLEKEKQKQEEKDRKEAEKNRKEKERLEKLAEKEREKLEKQKVKEEEKKKKQEALDAKAEEKRKKEEEKEADRKRKEEEKVKLEEGKSRKIQQSQAIFKSFFKKVEKPDGPPMVTENVGSFAAFQVLENMKMAPTHRVPKEGLPARCELLDSRMEAKTCNELYLTTLKNGAIKPGSDTRTWPADDVIIVDPNVPNEPTMKGKLYQFHENYRPAYFGTWRKRSKTISPRNPFKKDEVYLDYDVESDDEWEEEEPGESLSNSEDEKEEGDEQNVEADEDDEDGFFVPHGYLSDGEGCEDDEEDCNPEKMKMRQMVKAKNFEAEMKKTTEILRMLVLGCKWLEKNQTAEPLLSPYKAVILVEEKDKPIPIDVEEQATDKPTKDRPGVKAQGVPDEAIPDLIRLVHGNMYSLKKLMKEFVIFWKRREKKSRCGESSPESKSSGEDSQSKEPNDESEVNEKEKDDVSSSISMRQLDMKIRSIASYERRADYRSKLWYVKDDILTQHQLKDLPVPSEWEWITKPSKAKKNVESATPLVSGRDSPSVNPNKGSIKQFAVPGVIQSMVPLPSIQTTKSTAAATPSTPTQNPPNKKTPKRITPITLFCSKSTNPAPAPKEKRCLSEPQSLPTSETPTSTTTEQDDDCMIVDMPFEPPLPSKSQPTLLSMFSQKEKKK